MRGLLLGLARLWLKTLRLQWPAGDSLPPGAVIILWHEHLPVCAQAFAGRGIHVLISKSRDGEWAARACAGMGYRVHRGSSSGRSFSDASSSSRLPSGVSPPGGSTPGASPTGAAPAKAFSGLRALARAAEAGPSLIGMALDGPRGPRRKPKPGSLWLARRLEVPLVPVAVVAHRAFRLGSWDRTVIPWPFSKVEIRLGPPVFPGSTAELGKAMDAAEAHKQTPVPDRALSYI